MGWNYRLIKLRPEAGFSANVILNGGAAGVRDRTSIESFDARAGTQPQQYRSGSLQVHGRMSCGPSDRFALLRMTLANGNLCLPLLELTHE